MELSLLPPFREGPDISQLAFSDKIAIYGEILLYIHNIHIIYMICIWQRSAKHGVYEALEMLKENALAERPSGFICRPRWRDISLHSHAMRCVFH